MNKFLREILIGIVVSAIVFIPFLGGIYLFALWNVSHTKNLSELDFSTENIIVTSIDKIQKKEHINHTSIEDNYLVIHTNTANEYWKAPNQNITLKVLDTIKVKYRTKQKAIALSNSISGKIQRFFSNYGNQILIYKITKGETTIFEKEINSYDKATTKRGNIFMSIFVVVYIFLVVNFIKFMKKKGLWFEGQ